MKQLILACIFGCLILLHAQAQALEVSVTDAAFAHGEQASIAIMFKDNPLKDVYAIDIVFDFDANALQLDRIDKGKTVAQFHKVENREEGSNTAKVALIGLFPLNAAEGELLTLHFTARTDNVRARGNILNVTHVLFSTDQTALSPEKITQGEVLPSKF